MVVGFNTLLPGYVSSYLQKNAIVFGIAEMSYGIGAVFVGIFISLVRIHNFAKTIIIISGLVGTIMLLALPMTGSLPHIFAIIFIFGASNTTNKILLQALFMAFVPKRLFGATMATSMGCSSLVQVVLVFTLFMMFGGDTIQWGFTLLGVILFVSTILSVHLFGKSSH